MSDPRKAATLGEAALNADGKTYNGAKLLSWLSETVSPGKGLSEDKVQAMWDAEQAKRKAAR